LIGVERFGGGRVLEEAMLVFVVGEGGGFVVKAGRGAGLVVEEEGSGRR
jgi:hypothetical protein